MSSYVIVLVVHCRCWRMFNWVFAKLFFGIIFFLLVFRLFAKGEWEAHPYNYPSICLRGTHRHYPGIFSIYFCGLKRQGEIVCVKSLGRVELLNYAFRFNLSWYASSRFAHRNLCGPDPNVTRWCLLRGDFQVKKNLFPWGRLTPWRSCGGLQRFAMYLLGTKSTVCIDHKVLCILKAWADQQNKRLSRMALLLQNRSSDIQFVPGKRNTLAEFI